MPSGWPDASPGRIAAGEVALWRIHIPRFDVEAARRVLIDTELARADRFIKNIDRERFVVSRAGLRRILGAATDTPPREVPIAIAEDDKPYLAGDTGLRFNLSHSGDLALVAVAYETELGADVEMMRDIDVDALSTRFFSAAECAILAGLPAEQRHDAFFCTWVRKEAYIKGRGNGLRLPLHSFDVTLPRHVEAALLASRNYPEDTALWRMAHLEVDDGYHAAVAMKGPASVLRLASLTS